MIADQVLELLKGSEAWKSAQIVKDLAGLKRLAVAQKA